MKLVNVFAAAGLGILALSTPSLAQKKSKKGMEQQTFTLKTKIDTVSYALGANIAENLKQQGFENLSLDAFAQAFKDVADKKQLLVSSEQARNILNEYFAQLQQEKANKNLAEGQKFLEENKKKPGVVTLPSGLQYQVIKEGDGPTPKATDKVTTHYHGTLINGTVFDSSVERGQPATFPVNGVIQGWVEALQLMKVGSKWRLFVPSNLAYGERGAGESIGPNTTLIFEVELLSISQ
ncbi:peptidylprolyl isomerase [Sporocytophaga myxococcoides]|uniref:Peptidyl-prolyl cis-trans isomerase n=1 Tax=Sporocytophaga myxococcoides TaxID=153721 RepID=A0A098LHY6_9BACT|nr:FKBP-type peptidyl-prolyl cis-trans isomerase [Sporocytophaga myxococcoides]GAL86601.1 peptidylprolyl isomerase [Sporocytophaga myxococcoides]